MSTDLRHLLPRTLSGPAAAVGAMLSLLLIAHVSRAGPEQTKATTLQQRLESASVLREFSTEGAELRQLAVTENRIGFFLWKSNTDSTIALVYDFSGARRFRLAAPPSVPDSVYSGIAALDLSEDGSTVVISVLAGYEALKSKVYDIDGTLLFELNESAVLLPSPRGQYFCKLYDDISTERLAIYDRSGRLIKRFERPWRWNCRFLDDDHLVVADEDTVRIIETRTGNVISAFALSFAMVPLFHSKHTPQIALSRTRSIIAVYDEQTLLVLTADGKELWRKTFKDLLCAVAFDHSMPRMALHFRDWGMTYGYLEVMSAEKGDSGVVSARIPSLAHSGGPQRSPAFWLADNVITYWIALFPTFSSAPQPTFTYLGTDMQLATLLLTCDGHAGSLGDPVMQSGFYYFLDRTDGTARYLLVGGRGTPRLVSVALGNSPPKEER